MKKDTIKELRKLTAVLPVTRCLHYRDFLKSLYAAMKALLPEYSYLQLAEDLGFSRTNVLRLVIAGQRPLTVKAAEKIAQGLALTGSSRKFWLTMVAYNGERLPARRDRLFQDLMSLKTESAPHELDPLQAEYFSEWYHPVIREMTGLAAFDGSPEWIRDHLAFPLRLEQIRRSLEVLAGLRVIRFAPEFGRYVRTDETIRTDAEVDSMAIVRYHQKMIEIGKEAVTTVDEQRRDVRAVTISVAEKHLPLLKGRIEEWILEMAAMEGDPAETDQVVQINVQMFPFTRK
jgi:uncharacterized protein (TIGR02147 family)